MKKLIVGLIAVVVVLLGCNVWLSLELVDVLSANKDLAKATSNSVTASNYEWTNPNADRYWIGYGGVHNDTKYK